MWFKKKRSSDKEAASDEVVAVSYLHGRQLTERAINRRSLKQYDEALKLSKRAYREFNYIPAASIHANTLVMVKRYDEAISWLETVFSELKGEDKKLAKIEIASILISLLRDYAKDTEKAEEYLVHTRQVANSVKQSKELKLVESGLDIEEAVLLYNRGESDAAKLLATKRLKYVPDCQAAKLVLSRINSVTGGSTQIYGQIISSSREVLIEDSAQQINIRVYRGMEELYTTSMILAALLLAARASGWKADCFFTKNDRGNEALIRESRPRTVKDGDAIALSIILKPTMGQVDGVRELIDFFAEGAFIIEEA